MEVSGQKCTGAGGVIAGAFLGTGREGLSMFGSTAWPVGFCFPVILPQEREPPGEELSWTCLPCLTSALHVSIWHFSFKVLLVLSHHHIHWLLLQLLNQKLHSSQQLKIDNQRTRPLVENQIVQLQQLRSFSPPSLEILNLNIFFRSVLRSKEDLYTLHIKV